MDENKTRESKKTVVAFVAGLLIGGLLVWVFSAEPESATENRDRDVGNTAVNGVLDASADGNGETMEDTGEGADITSTTASGTTRNGTGDTFAVADQPAGTTVTLGGAVQYPTQEGWIVVHEDAGGELGRALGAVRYDTEAGLLPVSVELLRGTERDMTYHVVYYAENGDRVFDLKVDAPLTRDGGELVRATFTAK